MSKSLAVIVYTDWGARGNPGPAWLWVYICTQNGVPIERRYKYLGETTNNVAEYTGGLMGIELAIGLGATEIELRADSKLMIEQLAGRFKIKSPHLKVIYSQIQTLLTNYSGVIRFTHIPREHNIEADRLSNIAMDEGMGRH